MLEEQLCHQVLEGRLSLGRALQELIRSGHVSWEERRRFLLAVHREASAQLSTRTDERARQEASELVERCAGALSVLQSSNANGTPAEAAPGPEGNGASLTPEIREWALRQFTEEELADGLRELRERGGLELRDFLPELERMVDPK